MLSPLFRSRFPKQLLRICGGLLLLFACGCVTKTQDGGTSIYTYDWNTVLGACAATTAAAVFGGFRLAAGKIWHGIIGIVLSVGLAVAFVPGLIGDRLIVTADQMQMKRAGFFFNKSYLINFDDVNSATITMEERRGRRGRKEQDYYLNCNLNTGTSEKLALGELLSEALPEVFSHLDERQIVILDLRNQ